MTLNELIRNAQKITSLFPTGDIPLVVDIKLELMPLENGYIVNVWLENGQTEKTK